MSKREMRVAKQYQAEQKMLFNSLRQEELKQAEGNLLVVTFVTFIAFIFGNW